MSLPVQSIKNNQIVLAPVKDMERLEIGKVFLSFLDTGVTATARATYYNTKKDQEKAVAAIHEKLFVIDRGLYGLSLLMPGITDYNKQLALIRLLDNPYDGGLLSDVQENTLIEKLLEELPVQRRLNVFLELKKKRVNNARTRKLLLRTILNSDNLEYWSVKYRGKLKEALEHALGKRKTGIIGSILTKEKSKRNEKENSIVKEDLLKYVSINKNEKGLLECISFILGHETMLTKPYLVAYVEAKNDLSKGHILPYEVLEGIRSTYHKEKTTKEVLELTKAQLTKSQKLGLQRKAEKENVKVEFNAADYDAVRLYIYAYERGLTPDIQTELKRKSERSASQLPFQYKKTGVLVDNSASMTGDETQRMRPIAVALSIRDVIQAASKDCMIAYSNNYETDNSGLPDVQGYTDLANTLIELFEFQPEAIFIISDGYENAFAGRVNEVIRLARKIGIQTAVYQVSPVMSAEASGVKRLSNEAGVLAVNGTASFGISLIRGMFEVDLEKGLNSLLDVTFPKLLS